MNEVFVHQPVMLREAVEFLNLRKGDTVLDATTGLGGHSKEIIKCILPGGRLIGLDSDQSALRLAEENLKEYSPSFRLVNDNFRNLDVVLAKEGVKSINAALFDLGVSSYQMDEPTRGFSIRHNAKLDMRMNPSFGITAYDIVNKYNEDELSSVIERFGEERFHRRIAHLIVEARSKKPIETTHELAEVVHRAAGSRYGRSRIDPATRTFQAIRIVVNDELNSVEEGIKKAVFWLESGGRICVISFHSLEDRIVKNLFKGFKELGILRIITKKPLQAERSELLQNPRSRSAKLRVAEKV